MARYCHGGYCWPPHPPFFCIWEGQASPLLSATRLSSKETKLAGHYKVVESAMLQAEASCLGNRGELGSSSHCLFHLRHLAMPDITAGVLGVDLEWSDAIGPQSRGRDTRPQEAASQRNERTLADITRFSTKMADWRLSMGLRRKSQSAQ